MEELVLQINTVAALRGKLAQLTSAVRELQEKWAKDNAILIDSMKATALATGDAEAKLRELTISTYNTTGNKQPANGVGIRLVTKLDYDASVAFNWAKEHGLAIKLDTVAFEKIAKVDPMPFVAVIQTPQATIATELSVIHRSDCATNNEPAFPRGECDCQEVK